MTSIGLWTLLVSVLILGVEKSVALSALSLTGDPVPATEGGTLTLSCNRNTDYAPPLIGVIWYRNTEAIFQTVRGGLFPSNPTEYDEVSGRISVITSQQKHSVVLQINSSLDDGTVWTCSVEGYYSNNLTIVIASTVASDSPSQCRDSGTAHVLIGIGFGGWGVTIILAAAILLCRVCNLKRDTVSTRKSNLVHSVWICETSGSDVNNEYASSKMITGVSGSHGSNEYATAEMITGDSGSDSTGGYVFPKVITETAESDIHDEYTSTHAVTETSSSDISSAFASSEVKSDVTGTNGSDMHNKLAIQYMIAETIVSDEHYGYATGDAQSEDGQYTDIYSLDKPLYTDKGKEDSPYIQPVLDDLQTSTEQYITATFVSTDKNPVTNK